MDRYFIASAAIIAIIGAVMDLRTRRIPNRLTYTAMFMALSTKGILSGWSGLTSTFAAILIAGSIFCFAFLLGGMGGGDIKLITAVGAWAGVSHILPILIATAVSGGFLAVLYILRSTHTAQRSALRVPYGVAIAIGTVCCAGGAFLWR